MYSVLQPYIYSLALGPQSRSSGKVNGLPLPFLPTIASPLAYAGYLANADTSNTALIENCPPQPACDAKNKFRTPDGSCNNLKNAKYGMSATPLKRLLPSKYDDGKMIVAYI